MHRIFVYGSLMGGRANHHLMAGCRFVSVATTPPLFTLVDLGSYPGMLAGGVTAVSGEVYEVDAQTLQQLDRLEDHPHVYERRPIQLADGTPVLTYVLQPHQRKGAPEIRSGRWPDAANAGTDR